MRQLGLFALAGIRRNQHALRSVSRRTPTPMLLPLLRACSFRLENNAVACASVEIWLGRSATSCGPLVPRLRKRSASFANIPTEAITPINIIGTEPNNLEN